MNRILFLLAAIAVSFVSLAQGVQLGLRGGINNGNLTTELPGIDESKVKNGIYFGAFGRASLLGFFVQPELSYSQRVGNFEKVGVGTYTNTLNYFDIGAQVGYSLLGVIRLNFGPTLMTLLSTSQSGDALMKDANYSKDYYNGTAWGVQAGVGFDLGSICVDLRYDKNLTDLGKTNVNTATGPANYSTGFGLFQFTLGYKIIKI